ncbi:hypothetical protein M436DRAFT_80041 [Aureobasidium namibiae CBS 147.97]|uniref:Uncharacterized protein n=1 Tax=Aureobasidium namibiae CBS 147.97 TaxID=1043004 RepID=A0A074WR89_9PEZI|nr:uncharacterized protein M436DRAFT_80041 [Aureobasidium namibiae CBS 147.97]KEQ75638.1 hypothetical protein M436DRAFT_80041 [Aureobasidium namibiae CBS 147.97]
MGLPIFICPTNHQIISSGGNPSHSSLRTPRTSTTDPSSTTTALDSSTHPSPTTSFFATATPTRSSPTTPTATSFPSTAATASDTVATQPRRNTYTPPTFSPSTARRESLLSTHRLSQAFDFASALAVGVLAKAADSVYGGEGQQQQQGMLEGIWGEEDLEAGERQREKESRDQQVRYARFGDEGAFEGWLD